MRITRRVGVAVAVLAALFASACTSTTTGSGQAVPVSASPHTSATGFPSRTGSTPKQYDQRKVVDYFVSPERRLPLQKALDAIGGKLARDLLDGSVPSMTRGWDGIRPAPENGYGILMSLTGGPTAVQLTVSFSGGKVDVSKGISGVVIQLGGVVYELDGNTAFDDTGMPVHNAERAYGWCTYPLTAETISCLYMTLRQAVEDDKTRAYDPSKSYDIKLYPGLSPLLSIEDIKSADAAFIALISGLKVF